MGRRGYFSPSSLFACLNFYTRVTFTIAGSLIPMITPEQYKLIRAKHGEYGSWAVWADSTGKPKSNMGLLTPFDNPKICQQLKSNVVMVALNFSRPVVPIPFANFHDANPRAQDYKIRYAFQGTACGGAYMTDVIKRHVDVASASVMGYLKTHPHVVTQNLEIFREELADLRAERPLILAFGVQTHHLLAAGLKKSEYAQLVKLTHYSHQISQADFKQQVWAQIRAAWVTV